jgi:hypothetical protein
LLKFLFESIVISQAPNIVMNLGLIWSQVRFRCRMGGEFNPETIAIMLEKFLSSRHR